MTRGAMAVIAAVVLLMAACAPAMCGRLEGTVTSVSETEISATFPAAVKLGSAMLVMSGRGESICGMAISQTCDGDGPYTVTGNLSWVNDPMSLRTGRCVYVNSMNSFAIPSRRYPRPQKLPNQDLGFYYYSAAQRVGYGALGVGLEGSLDLGDGLTIELDGGLTGLGSIEDQNGTAFSTDSLFKSLNGKVKLNLATGFSAYAGYRWAEGTGDDEKWDQLTRDLRGRPFSGPSQEDSGRVLLRGMEYGLAFGPSTGKMSFAVGYIPSLQSDYGGLGTLDEPAYTAEVRFGDKNGVVRIRGLSAEDYWIADLGITIK